MFRAHGNPPLGPYTEGEQTDPADDALMADTGALAAGNYEFVVTVGGSAAGDFAVQRRNAANNANVGTPVVIKGPAGQSGQYRYMTTLEAGERVRIVMDDALEGTAAAALNGERFS